MATEKIKRYLEEFSRFRGCGVFSSTGAHILLSLLDRGPTRPGDLARDLRVSATTVSEQLSRLIAKGLITLAHADPYDRRSAYYRITEAGREATWRLHSVFTEGEKGGDDA